MIDDTPSSIAPERSSRRRLTVFAGSFAFAAAISLIYVYARPAEYRATTLLEISPPQTVAESNDQKSPGVEGDPKSFLSEVQVLTSRPLLERVAGRLQGRLAGLRGDPVEAMQRMLHADPVKGTQMVQLSAEGPQQGLLADLVNTVAQVYRQQLGASFRQLAADIDSDVSDEAKSLHAQVLAEQQAVEDYRQSHDIVSLDRKENDVLAKIDGLNRSYADSNEQLAKAQGRLLALKSAMAAGKPIVRSEDSATLAAMEQQLSTLREKRTALDRRYHDAYLVLDEDTKNLPTQIAQLEQQLKDRRAASAREAITDAEGDLAAAESAAGRLRQDLDANQSGARQFAGGLSEFKAMQQDLDHLQAMERAVNDRAAKLKASVRERAPHMRLVAAAAPSLEPWRPNYTRDALIGLGGSLLLALLATWLDEFLHGPHPARPLLVQHSLALPPRAWPALGRMAAPAFQAFGRQLPGTADKTSLPTPPPPMRELDNAEIAALVAGASDDLRLIVLALLTGLDAVEITALRWNEIDLAQHVLNAGSPVRTIPLTGALAEILRLRQEFAVGGLVLSGESGAAMTPGGIDQLLLYGAYDAGLERPQEVTAAALRHTYLAFLLRQGMRAADIGRVAGHIPQEEMLAFMQSAAPRTRLPLEKIDLMHPALRGIGAGT